MSGYDIRFENALKYKDKETFDATLRSLSQLRREKILKIKDERTARLSMAAGVLMEGLLKQKGFDITDIVFNDKEKPELKNKEFYFNLSHAHEAAVIAFSEKPVGVDMEYLDRKIKPEGIEKRYFSEGERRSLYEADDLKKRFFEIWTMKEAYGKLKGGGISDALEFSSDKPEEFGVMIDHPGLRFFEPFAEDEREEYYIISVCQYIRDKEKNNK
ncbi:MAG: 4'-phosphopantetheinyl transferase superfamily protein [Lachnospiraceae bacterium]|nr:4'-phosphopantetheinyl transferase superfamily protein [Lachnospiraceae bacterium]